MKRRGKIIYILGMIIILGIFLFSGCSENKKQVMSSSVETEEVTAEVTEKSTEETTKEVTEQSKEEITQEETTEGTTEKSTEETTKEVTEQSKEEITQEETTEGATEKSIEETTKEVTEQSKEEITQEETIEENTEEETVTQNKAMPLIVIDAGHQGKGNPEKEPVGPGASEMKAKVATGTSGCVTGIPEYQLTLEVSLKLQHILESRGYNVYMIRTSHDVNISNAERAQVANNLAADAFIRIHANGSTNAEKRGALTICQTPSNQYNGTLYTKSKQLSSNVLDGLVSATGCIKEFVWETDTMSGINWANVPVTIVEMGYMSNPEEDRLMATEEYQQKIALGIANGVDVYFSNVN